MREHRISRVSYLSMYLLTVVAMSVASIAIAQPSDSFTFKLDQHESVLNDQAVLENLEVLIASGDLSASDPAVQAAKLQQYMSAYNALCTLKTSAKDRRTQPTISIGNGFEKSSDPLSPFYDPNVKPGELIYFPSGSVNTFNRNADPNNLHVTTAGLHIVGFRITLGSTADLYEFGLHPTNNQNALPMVVPSNTSITSSVDATKNVLVIDFNNGGLMPGQMATMRIQLNQDDSTSLTPWPFMTDFFSNDSELTVIYQDPDTMVKTEADPVSFAGFLNQAVEWVGQLNTPSQHIDGYIPSFELGGSSPIIPEPGSMVFALGGLSCLLLARRRGA